MGRGRCKDQNDHRLAGYEGIHAVYEVYLDDTVDLDDRSTHPGGGGVASIRRATQSSPTATAAPRTAPPRMSVGQWIPT